MAVLYLIFNEGYSASSGDAPVRQELCAEAIRLAQRARERCCRTSPSRLGWWRSCSSIMPGRPRGSGPTASPILLDDQDRRLWDADIIAQGEAAIHGAADAGWVGGYCLQAAIAREHVRAATAADDRLAGDRRPLRRPGRGARPRRWST